MKPKYHVGAKVGQATILQRTKISDGNYKVLCKCDCGQEFDVWNSVFVKENIHNVMCRNCLEQRKRKELIEPMIGKKFGDFTVKNLVETDTLPKRKWLCECVCGNTKIYSTTLLKKHTHCGCKRQYQHMVTMDGVTKHLAEWCRDYNLPLNVVSARLALGWSIDRALTTEVTKRNPNLNLKGEKFNDLTVIKKKNRLWICVCRCGREITASQYQLQSGKKSDCGCSMIHMTYKGERKTVREFSEQYKISTSVIYSRIKEGWTASEILSTPT